MKRWRMTANKKAVVALDDVDMQLEVKGYAADIHAHHTTDKEEEEEEAEEERPKR